MTKHRFRLQPVLRLREVARDQCRQQLAQAYEAGEILRQRDRQLEAECTQTRQQTESGSGPGAVNVDRLVQLHRYLLLLEAQRQQLKKQMQLIEAEIERRRLALTEADRQVKVLEKLRDRQQRKAAWEESVAEQRQMDEVALHRFTREKTA